MTSYQTVWIYCATPISPFSPFVSREASVTLAEFQVGFDPNPVMPTILRVSMLNNDTECQRYRGI